MSVESRCFFEICSAKCFLEVINGVSGNNRIRKFDPVAYDSIAEMILCKVKLKLRGLRPLVEIVEVEVFYIIHLRLN